MRISTLLTLLMAILTVGFSTAQNQARKPKDIVQASKRAGVNFQPASVFNLSNNQNSYKKELENTVENFELLTLKTDQLKKLLETAPQAIEFVIPSISKSHLVLELVKINDLTSDATTVVASTNSAYTIPKGIHYRGVLKNDPRSVVAISIFREQVMGLISTDKGNLVLGKVKGPSAEDYIIYDDQTILQTLGLECGTLDDGRIYRSEELEPASTSLSLDDCVRLYFEVDHDIFLDKETVENTHNFVTGLANLAATLFANEEINTVISTIYIWDIPSPYTGGASSNMLNEFRANRPEWSGDLAQLLSYQSSGGIAAGFSGICNANRGQSMSFSKISDFYNEIPVYSWSVMVVTHEFGHLFGSRHTHACVWNGDGTAIDGCAGSTEGGCPLPGNPAGGGTIMSYCHNESVGINFVEGFGDQPGNVIRNVITDASCLIECGPPTCDDGIQNNDETGVDCGGEECPACPTCEDGIQNGSETGVDCGGPECDVCICTANELILTITFDNYPEESTWEVQDDTGATLAAGGPYGHLPDGSTYTENICVIDGCFNFVFNDTYGDGICCGYGNGSYELADQDDNILALGGDFGFSESTEFCVSSAIATCDDEIQNGDETGVDCGGSNCPACPTCDDEIQNGDETGVDCGGSNCPACPTCDDEIQNGDETGVDCGGSNCPACPTCDDEIQNGDETGVDCGGSCDPCDDGTCQGTEVNLSIVFDNYPEETSWMIKNSAGEIVASGGDYSDQEEGALMNENLCLEDDCYTFTIYDSYADGMCCRFGDGEYTLVSLPDSTILAEGNVFESEEETAFVLGGNMTCPTCDDGLQNGMETAIDCGGPDCLPCGNSQCTYEIVDEEDFEAGWGIWNDGGSDARRNFRDKNYANSGTYCVRLRDNTNTSVMTTDVIDGSDYMELTVQFSYYARSMDNENEDFWLQISTDDGESFTTIEEWNKGDEFENNERYFDTISIDGPFSATTRLRFRSDASSNPDYVYIDDVTILGCAIGNLLHEEARTTGGPTIEERIILREKERTPITNFNIFPNPTNDILNVTFTLPETGAVKLHLTDINGTSIQTQNLHGTTGKQSTRLDVRKLTPGIYILNITSVHGVYSKKFLKIN